MVVTRQCIRNRRVVAAFDNHLVKAHVEVVIGLKVFLGDKAFVEQLIAFVQAALEGFPCFWRQAPLSGLAGGQAFEYAAHLHGPCDVIGADRAHLKAPSAKTHQQPFLLQGAKRHAHGHARDAE
ncbi:hypothetical protein D3C78_1335970 [compost metagenome]